MLSEKLETTKVRVCKTLASIITNTKSIQRTHASTKSAVTPTLNPKSNPNVTAVSERVSRV